VKFLHWSFLLIAVGDLYYTVSRLILAFLPLLGGASAYCIFGHLPLVLGVLEHCCVLGVFGIGQLVCCAFLSLTVADSALGIIILTVGILPDCGHLFHP
jgi:hypothetical protein